MNDLKRWTFVGIAGMSAPKATAHWRETPDGKWVDYEDVAALEARFAAVTRPVSDAEWVAFGESRLSRNQVDALIATRAKEARE